MLLLKNIYRFNKLFVKNFVINVCNKIKGRPLQIQIIGLLMYLIKSKITVNQYKLINPWDAVCFLITNF